MIPIEREWQKEIDQKELALCMEIWREDSGFVFDCECRYLSGLVEEWWPEFSKKFFQNLKKNKPKEYLGYLDEGIKFIKKSIVGDYKSYEEHTARDVDYVTKQVWLLIAGTEEKIKKLKQLEIEKSLMFLPPNKNRINDADITRALAFPITDIVGKGKNKMVKCINHQPDKHPSMSIKNNFAYCFTCGYFGSAIDVAMKVWSVGFIEAVRRMSR